MIRVSKSLLPLTVAVLSLAGDAQALNFCSSANNRAVITC